MDSQDSQFTQRYNPPGQRDMMEDRKIGGRIPKDDKEMIMSLATSRKDDPVGSVLNSIKIKNNFEKNLKI